ncbi:MAG: HIT domain-containing protein [Candidatus Omnitrophica bacterium]|nr:HIT domain-containing protein [Candidatus Omnitrophota bacterium]
MDNLWAPWRSAYVEKCSKPKTSGCTFCNILKARQDKKNFIFLRTDYSFAVLNIYPFNAAHSLVIPQRHVPDLSALRPEERADLMDTLVVVQDMIRKAFAPQAFNIGMNIGHLAGAGVPEHLHIHVVPRWSGDVNFMPVLFDTKVIPVSLKSTYERLLRANKS